MSNLTSALGVQDFIGAFNLGLRDQHMLEAQTGGEITARYFYCSLSSVFQPIVAAQGGGAIGHQGLLRCYGGGVAAPTSPWGVFSLAGQERDLVDLDRLCRTLHMLNYFRQHRESLSLFLNINFRLLTAVKRGFGHDFEQRLKNVGLRPHSIVIELPAQVFSRPDLLARATADYQGRGYRIAARHDGFANGLSVNLRKARPDIVRVSAGSGSGGSFHGETAKAIHDIGALALADKIETAAQEAHARHAGFDLLQGFHIGRPETSASCNVSRCTIAGLFSRRERSRDGWPEIWPQTLCREPVGLPASSK